MAIESGWFVVERTIATIRPFSATALRGSTSLQNQMIEAALCAFFADNRSYWGKPINPRKYGVELISADQNTAVIRVRLRLLAGVKYSNFEPGDHCSLFWKPSWTYFRELLTERGVIWPTPATVIIEGVVEAGAIHVEGGMGPQEFGYTYSQEYKEQQAKVP